MPGSWIHSCTERTFDAFKFTTAKGKTDQLEGRFWQIRYYPQATQNPKPSVLQIQGNFENAVKKLGGSVIYQDNARLTMKLENGGKEAWVEVTAEFTGKYSLTILEKQGMEQDIEANADVFANDIRLTGHSAVYGILFDTGKSILKPESEKTIGEVVKLLKSDPALKLYVVGHTDNVGGLESNLKLAQERSDAVVKALVTASRPAVSRASATARSPPSPLRTRRKGGQRTPALSS